MPEPVEINVGFMARDLKLSPDTVQKVIDLLDAGFPVPFIARYRKDETDNLPEEQLWALVTLLEEQKKLVQRKQTILRSIDSLGVLTPELERRIIEARTNRRLEDIYLPYKPQKQTLASAAKEQGLEPLANEFLEACEETAPDLQQRASEFINAEKNLSTADEVLRSTGYIISEKYANNVELRQRVRDIIRRQGRIVTNFIEKKKAEEVTGAAPGTKSDTVQKDNVPEADKIESITPSADIETSSENSTPDIEVPDIEAADIEVTESKNVAAENAPEAADTSNVTDTNEETTPQAAASESAESRQARKKQEKLERQQKEEEHLQNLYRDYTDFSMEIRVCPPHRILAINRAEKANVLRVRLDIPKERIGEAAYSFIFDGVKHPYQEYLSKCLEDALARLIIPSLEREIRAEMLDKAETQSIEVFAKNLRNLLLQKPLLRRRVLAIDPGFTHGCKLAALDEFGNVLDHDTIFIKGNAERRKKIIAKLADMINKYNISILAIGNGTGCREAEEFVTELIAEHFSGKDVAYIIVNEAGASVYSVSSLAREEFPTYNSLTCGAISIGRRLQDALNELVKIDPGSLGVGMYQHDLKAKALKNALTQTVESCVNQVGVDLNAATPAILRYVAGLNQLTAKRIYEYRIANGPFRKREQLKDVSGFGDAAFTHSAGFLKISDGYEPLDSTWIHPESYDLARKILDKIGFTSEDLNCSAKKAELLEKIKGLNPGDLKDEFQAGLHTITDILDQIIRPGRDPRTELPSPIFKKGTLKMEDLEPGMELTGTVLNVVDFGAFIDIGLHQSGLVHISHLGDQFVKDAHTRVAVGDIVKVWVLAVDTQRHRISLTMIEPGHERPKRTENVDNSAEKQTDNNRRSGEYGGPRRQNNRQAGESKPTRERRDNRSRDNSERRNSSDSTSGERRNKDYNRDERRSAERVAERSSENSDRRSSVQRNKVPGMTSLPPKSKAPVIPISEDMKKGKEPLRSFSDLAQLFGNLNPDQSEDQEKKEK